MKLKPIELSTYMKRYGDSPTEGLFVLNRTKPRGNLGFTCVGELNRPISVIVPATFIPVDLTDTLPRSKLLESSSFRRQLTRGDLAIVDNKEVAELFATSQNAIKERKRLLRINDDIDEEVDIEEDANTAQTLNSDVVEFINEMVSRSNEGEDADSLIGLILNKSDELAKEDMMKIINGVTDSRLKEKVAEIMNDLMD